MEFLPLLCNDACLVKNTDGKFRCQKLYNFRVINNNKKHQFMPLTNDYSVSCLKILQCIGLNKKLHIYSDGNVLEFKICVPLFHPYRHVPPTNTTNCINIYPVEGYTFSVLKSIHNVQVLTAASGCSKYISNYIEKLMKK